MPPGEGSSALALEGSSQGRARQARRPAADFSRACWWCWGARQGSSPRPEDGVAVPAPRVVYLGPHRSLGEVDGTIPTLEMRKLRFRGGTLLTQVTRAGFEPSSVSPQENSGSLPRKTYWRMAS